MAIDGKYGRVTTEHGDIGDDEPVVVFRAKDRLLPRVLEHYRDLCEDRGSPQHHLDLIDVTTETVINWQIDHGSRVPTSDAYMRRIEQES